jgi:mannan endo-1,4-beta-mannosidase
MVATWLRDYVPDGRTRRRRVLRTLGVTGTGALAGCTGVFDGDESRDAKTPSGSTTPETPAEGTTDAATTTPDAVPRITDLSIDSDPARQTDIVTVTLTATNDGPVSFGGHLAIGDGDSTLAAEETTISAGETVTVVAEREVLRVGEHEYEGSVSHAGEQVAHDRTSVQVRQSPSSFVDVDGTSFTLDDGTFYLSGANPSGEFTLGFGHPHHDELRPYMFEGLSRVGATISRILASTNASLRHAAPFPGEDNEEFFSRFDEIIVRAKRRNVRLAIPIISAAPSYRTDPEENISTHVPAFVHRSDTAEEINDFYHDDQCIALYKQWVEELLTRENHLTGVEYRNDPTIMMWELGNEVEYIEAWTRDSQTIRPWIEEVGSFVKDLAGDQLLTTGTHGWPDGRNDFVEDHRPDCIDVCSLHWYVGPAGYDLPEDEAAALLDEKIADAHETLEKPLWFSEYNWGYPGGGNAAGLEDEFLERRNSKLREWHDKLDDAEVAATALHELTSKHVLENMMNRTREKGSTEVYADADTGTVEELRRYARVSREKSTSSAVPDLPPNE